MFSELGAAARARERENLLGANYQEKGASCLVACTRNSILEQGGTPPSEAALRAMFDKLGSHNWESGGSLLSESAAVLSQLGYSAEVSRVSLNSLLKLDKPAILGVHWKGGGGHALLLTGTSHKRFLFFFKYARKYTIIDPWNYSNPGRNGVASSTVLTSSQLKNYRNQGRLGNQGVVFGN